MKINIMENSIELNQVEIKTLLSRMPAFELSYEIFKHNTTTLAQTSDDEWSFHIPNGHKWIVWFSFRGKKHGLYWMELNKKRDIQRVFFQEATPPSSLEDSVFYSTILYGTQIQSGPFVLEDVFYFKGNFVHCLPEIHKWALFPSFLQKHSQYGFCLPIINGSYKETCYPTHHIQIRHLTKIRPFINCPIPKYQHLSQPNKPTLLQNEITVLSTHNETGQPQPVFKPVFKNLRKEQYKQDTVFSVQSDPADDIYRLFTFGPNRQLIFYDFCMIQDFETSKKMNTIFRHVRENQNLDWIEESDDESSINEEPVNTEKHHLIMCRFHIKFRKWIPLYLAPSNSRIVHICKL